MHPTTIPTPGAIPAVPPDLRARDYVSVIPKGVTPLLPSIESLRFRSAPDVVALAKLDYCFGRMTWPEVWHLDNGGKVRCYHRGSSLDSVRAWAEQPESLLRPRVDHPHRLAGCPDRWVVIDSRPRSRYPPPTVEEADIEAFEQVRLALASIAVVLLDVVVFDDEYRWWSLREIATGSTEWPKVKDRAW